MLPRVASTTGTPQPPPAPQAGQPAEAARPALSAAALANLRAEILLRLLETMLRHLPRGPEGAGGRDLLEALFTALKSLPARNETGGRRLADLLSRLPPEVRPAVEKLVGTTLSALPTRDIVTILRNPDTPDAQRLAVLLASRLAADDGGAEALAARAERPQRTAGLTVPQIAAVERRGDLPLPVAVDARSLQSVLKRIFEPDAIPADDEVEHTQPSAARLAVPAERQQAAQANAGRALPSEAVETARQAPRAEAASAAMATAEAGETAEEEAAPSVMQAVARKAPVEVLARAITRLLAHLSEDEALIVRTLLDRPLDLAAAPGRASATPTLAPPDDADGQAATPTAAGDDAENGAKPADGATVRREPPPPADLRRAAVPDETRAAARPTPEALAAIATEAAAAAPLPALREGIPLAFVPYLTAGEDLDTGETETIHEEEDTGEEDAGERPQGDEGESPDEAEPETEMETEDMARRRERIDTLVGDRDGISFSRPQPGEYWT